MSTQNMGAVIFFLLIVLGGCETIKTDADGKPTPPKMSVPTSAPTPAPHWYPLSVANEMDGTTKYAIVARSDSSEYKAQIMIACESGKMDISVITNRPSQPELGQYETHTIRMKFDNDVPTTQMWRESIDYQALYAPSSLHLLYHMLYSKKLVFEFTAFKEGNRALSFDLSGLREAFLPIAASCGVNDKL